MFRLFFSFFPVYILTTCEGKGSPECTHTCIMDAHGVYLYVYFWYNGRPCQLPCFLHDSQIMQGKKSVDCFLPYFYADFNNKFHFLACNSSIHGKRNFSIQGFKEKKGKMFVESYAGSEGLCSKRKWSKKKPAKKRNLIVEENGRKALLHCCSAGGC